MIAWNNADWQPDALCGILRCYILSYALFEAMGIPMCSYLRLRVSPRILILVSLTVQLRSQDVAISHQDRRYCSSGSYNAHGQFGRSSSVQCKIDRKIHIPDCGSGWKPTQHVLLRVMRGRGIFESHPFTITNAPSTTARQSGITLYAKVAGDWTRRLHRLASNVQDLEIGEDIIEREAFLAKEKITDGTTDGIQIDHPGKRVMVMLDGPYGGLKMDLGEYRRVLLVAGGSGITFALGSIEEAIIAKSQGGLTQAVELAWVARDVCE